MNMRLATMHNFKTSRGQRGAVLIVALIMLLLLTLVGVAGMRDTQLQEKMAGGNEDRALAFQAAEAALRAGEAAVMTGVYMGSCAGLCFRNYTIAVPAAVPQRLCNVPVVNTPCSETMYWQAYNWSAPNNSTLYTGTTLVEVANQPRYVIEQMPVNYSSVPGTTNGGAVGPGKKTITDFLITARGTGRTDDAVVILQSLYRHVN